MDNIGHTFLWKIEKFLLNACSEGECIKSPSFNVKICGFNTAWCLRIYPSEKFQFIECYVKKIDETGPEEVDVHFTLSWILPGENESDCVTDYCKIPEMHCLYSGCKDHWFCFKKVKLQNSLLFFPYDNFGLELNLWRYSLEETPFFECIALTRIEQIRISYRKVILNLNSLRSGRIIIFSIEPYPALQVLLYVKEKSEYISVEFQHEKFNRGVRLNCVLCVVKPDGISFQREDNFLFKKQNDAIWSFPDFILLKDLSSVNIITMHFKLCIVTGKTRSEIYNIECVAATTSKEIYKTRHDLDLIISQYQEEVLGGMLPDVKLKSNNQTYSAHKCVLSKYSSFFLDKFKDEMNKNEDQMVIVEDMDPETLEMFLRFVYETSLKGLNEAMAIKLISAANKYQVSNLKEQCTFYLKTHVSADNACELLPIAHSHKLESLKRALQVLICIYYRDIFATDEWEQLTRQHVELASEIFDKLSLKYKKK